MGKYPKSKKEEDSQDAPFNGSLDTLSRINNIINDITAYRINGHWLGMRENLGELLIEAQGCLTKAELKKAWNDWEKIENEEIVFNEDGLVSYDEKLPEKLKKFSRWLRMKLYKHNLTMAKTSGTLDKMSMLHKKYGI